VDESSVERNLSRKLTILHRKRRKSVGNVTVPPNRPNLKSKRLLSTMILKFRRTLRNPVLKRTKGLKLRKKNPPPTMWKLKGVNNDFSDFS
jgi:hypothetical protein